MTIAAIHASMVVGPYGPSMCRISSQSKTLAPIASGIRLSAVVTRSTWVKAGSTGSSPSMALIAPGSNGSVGWAAVSVMILPLEHGDL
ncbi:MAG: hypothetical protein C0520_02720 [Sphingopyxis sp.]|nr:hypothetical protein [Sphingopyxis sp.]